MSAENRAFELEYRKPINTDSLRDDVISYLGEYRFRLPSYDYNFFYSRGPDGLFALRDKYDGDSMKDKAARAIKRNEKNNKPTNREQAELKGLQALEQQLETTINGDMVLWVSPPGPKEEGYGNYGFVYIGSIHENSENEKRIDMTAIRINNPSLNQFNSYLSFITDSKKYFQKDTEFLESPFVLNYSSEFAIKALLEMFKIEKDPEIHKKFTYSMEALSPVIESLISSLQNEDSIEAKQRIFNTLENLATKMYYSRGREYGVIIDQLESSGAAIAIRKYGNVKPEIVAGSCGASGSSNDMLSNNIFNSIGDFNSIFKSEGDDMFECPKCHKLSKPPVGYKCPQCEYTLDQFKKDHPELETCE